ncbi:hypothetical protein BFJ70_g15811 [Fusarium oxysporum]|nr:hypothetical protein BFJ70_g15811 [Fusarium oxysporum]
MMSGLRELKRKGTDGGEDDRQPKRVFHPRTRSESDRPPVTARTATTKSSTSASSTDLRPAPLNLKRKPHNDVLPANRHPRPTSQSPPINSLASRHQAFNANNYTNSSPLSDGTIDAIHADPVTLRAHQPGTQPIRAPIDQILPPDGRHDGSAMSDTHTYLFQDKKSEVMYDGVHFELKIGSQQELGSRYGIAISSEPTEHVYQIQDTSIKVASDGRQLTVIASDHQKPTADTSIELAGSVSQPLHQIVDAEHQRDEKLVCYGSIFEIKDKVGPAGVYCHLTIIDRGAFLDHIKDLRPPDYSLRYIHLKLDKIPGARFNQEIGNLVDLIEGFKGVELDAVLDSTLPYERLHVIPVTINIHGPETGRDKIKNMFLGYGTSLIKPTHVASKFRSLLCNGEAREEGRYFLHCRQLLVLAITNFLPITKQSRSRYKWKQESWQRKEWQSLESEIDALTNGEVKFPRDGTFSRGASLHFGTTMSANDVISGKVSMVCIGSVIECDKQLFHLNFTSPKLFLEALNIRAPIDIRNLTAKDSADLWKQLSQWEVERSPREFYLSATDINNNRLCIDNFATLDEYSLLILHDLLKLSEDECRLSVVLDLSLPLECLRMTSIPIQINIYCSPEPAPKLRVERILDRWNLYLQHPIFVPHGVQYDNWQFLGKVEPAMVGSSEPMREMQLCYLVFENLAPEEWKLGLRRLFQEARNHDLIDLFESQIDDEIKWLVEPCAEEKTHDEITGLCQLRNRWAEQILGAFLQKS